MNRTQKWQKIAENRLVIMGDMEKQNDALEQQNRDLVAALEVACDQLCIFRALQGDTISHWDVDNDNALFVIEQALAQAGE